MQPSTAWCDNPTFVEIGVKDANLAVGLREAGYTRYLGVSDNGKRVVELQSRYPEVANQLTHSERYKIVRHNNAEALILSGKWMGYLWKYQSVRHAKTVSWECGLHPLSLVAFVGCLFQMISKRYSFPKIVSVPVSSGKTKRLFTTRVLRRKLTHRGCLHFIPHVTGLANLFREFDAQGVRYVVLRWFEDLPELEPAEDVDMLISDESLPEALEILSSYPGITPTDVYSEHGLSRSDYCGTPYYPAHVAKRLLDGATRHNEISVPNDWDYFHSLAYHATYHKGLRSNLPQGGTNDLPKKNKPSRDYAGILRGMADKLGVEVEITLEGLHAYLCKNNWGPSPEMLSRLAAECGRDKWLQCLASRLEPYLQDQGLTVFVLRERAIVLGYRDMMIDMIEQKGFEILAIKSLSPAESELGALRTRGGNWGEVPFADSGGPAVVVIAYDPDPQQQTWQQRRRFPKRTNGRIYAKEEIRDLLLDDMAHTENINALHSSDHAAEAWHLIEELAAELLVEIRDRVDQLREGTQPIREVRRAA